MTAEQLELLFTSLETMPRFLGQHFRRLSPGEGTEPGPAGAFSPVEHCWHLADLEREGFGVRIRRLLEESEPLLPDFDGDRIAEERGYGARSLRDGLEAFERARAANLVALRSVGADQWTRCGRQEGIGRVALADIPRMMMEHDAAHRAEIEEWSHMRRTR